MQTNLYGYQEKIRNIICDSGDTAWGLFMKMGTGKTVTSLSIFERFMELGKVNKLLVVCLKCKIEDWKTDIQKEFATDNGDVFFDYEVINFESIWRPKRADYFMNYVDNNTMVIVDESQKMKGVSTKISKYLLELKERTKYKLILTGTPQSKQYIDYYPQMRFIDAKDYDMPYRQWDRMYVRKKLVSDYGPWHYEIEGYNFEDVLLQGITDKAQYHEYQSEYETPIEIYQDIEHSKDAIKFQKKRVWPEVSEEQLATGDVPDNLVMADTQFALRNYLRQSLSGFIGDYDIQSPKEEWLKDFLEITQDRVVIFTNYIKEIEKVEEICKKLNKPISWYYGAKKDLTAFKTCTNGVAIVNYASGAVGINDLCISNIGVFYSPPDGDYILFSQAKARLDRIGQTKQPVFYYLQTKGSIEKPIYDSFKEGKDFDQKCFDLWLENQ